MSPSPDSALRTRALRRVGSSLCGRYTVRALIGTGGMGAVYAGVHRNGHAVAIKILHDRLSRDPEIERMFRREALLSNKIQHSGVVPVIDDDVSDDGCIFLVMPLLQGETLRARAERYGRRLAVEEVVLLGHALLEALAAAHDGKIVHRDIKPENIFVTRDGEVRVFDFGIARFFESTDPVSATRSGRAVGTPAFMAPEQALGRVRDIDGKTDLWAAGATMFTLLSGRLVHEAQTPEETLVFTATKHATPLRSVCPELPASVCDVVDRALAFHRSERWPDAREMAFALEEACRDSLHSAIATLPRLSTPPAEPSLGVHFADTLVSSGGPHSTPSIAGPRTTGRIAITRTMATTGRTGRTVARTSIGLAALAALTVGGVTAWRLRAPIPSQVPLYDVKALAGHLTSANAAWLGGRPEAAAEEFRAALQINDVSAEARMGLVRLTPLWPTEADRDNFVRAQDVRDSLPLDQRKYLDALAPAMSLPADFPAELARLRQLHTASPADLDVTLALSQALLRLNLSEEALPLLSPLASGENVRPLLLGEYGSALAAHDDDAAASVLTKCSSENPAATFCLEQLSQLDLLEGRCAEGERLARQELALNPQAVDAYVRLAEALDERDAPEQEVQHVLDKASEFFDGPRREIFHFRTTQQMAIRRGQFQAALAIDAPFAKAVESLSDDALTFDFTARSMALKAELGHGSEAVDALHHYTESRQVLARDPYGGDNVMYLEALATHYALVPWDQWLSLRASRLSTPTDRDFLQDGPQRSWLEYFAIPTRDRSEALEALHRLPATGGVLRRSDRWPLHDAAIGTVLSLGGRSAEATRYFERASHSCVRLENPLEYTQALAAFAKHLESNHETERACQLYHRITAQWPASSGSATASFAGERERTACPTTFRIAEDSGK